MAAYSDNNFKQKVVIEFLLKQGIAAKEISDRLRNVYGLSALSYPTVRRWVAMFKGGRSPHEVQTSSISWKGYDYCFLGQPWRYPPRLST